MRNAQCSPLIVRPPHVPLRKTRFRQIAHLAQAGANQVATGGNAPAALPAR